MPMRVFFVAFASENKIEDAAADEPPQIPTSNDHNSTLAFTEKVGRLKHGLCETNSGGSSY
jgi:hypothetical protein